MSGVRHREDCSALHVISQYLCDELLEWRLVIYYFPTIDFPPMGQSTAYNEWRLIDG